jgi:hypothetical protein
MLTRQYDPETFNSRTQNPPLDLTTEMDKYVQLPLEVKAERLKAAWAHSEQSEHLEPGLCCISMELTSR